MKFKILLLILSVILVGGAISYAASPSSSTKTADNLKAALLGETTASAKYFAYAEKAKQDGYNKVALLFTAAANAEKIHASNHKAVLEQLGVEVGNVEPNKFEVKSTKENLQDAIDGESYEVATMYPEFLKTAQEGNVSLAMITFNYAYQTEKKHKAMYTNALEKLNGGEENTLPELYMVCTTCGNTYDGPAPKRCGISMTPSERFLTIQ